MASRESFAFLFDIFLLLSTHNFGPWFKSIRRYSPFILCYHTIQDWRRRFFILKGSRLFFAKNPHDLPHGMIDLSRCTTVKSADLKAHKKHSFEISTPETTFLLYAGE